MHVGADEYHKYPGASHCDELPYLFKTGEDTKIEAPAIDSKELKAMKTMVETFTSFALNGDPNNSEIKENWEEIKSGGSTFKCMNITGDEAKMIPLPEGEGLKTWDEMFKRENVELY